MPRDPLHQTDHLLLDGVVRGQDPDHSYPFHQGGDGLHDRFEAARLRHQLFVKVFVSFVILYFSFIYIILLYIIYVILFIFNL